LVKEVVQVKGSAGRKAKGGKIGRKFTKAKSVLVLGSQFSGYI
jgi:hypothetical protein